MKIKKNGHIQKGITLIALIITIIILIILSAITINFLFKHNIIEIAKEGTENYAVEQIEEKKEFDGLAAFLSSVTKKIMGEVTDDIENNPEQKPEDKPEPPEEPKKIEGYVANGLVLCYDAINNTGNGHDFSAKIWKDLSGNNNDGTLNGCMWGQDYLELDGSSDGIQIGSNLKELFKADNTIEIVLLFNQKNARDVIIGNYNASNSINYEKYNKDNPRIWINSGTIDEYGTSILDIGKYQTLSYVMDKNNDKIRLAKNANYKYDVTGSQISLYNYDWEDVWIGRDSRTGSTCMKGKILSVRVYERKLTDEEIKENHENDKQRFKNFEQVEYESKIGYVANGLILNYDAINNTGNGHSSSTKTWKDLTENNNDGILNGCTWGTNYLELNGVEDGVNLGNKLQELFQRDNTIEITILFSEKNARDVIIGNYNESNSINYEKYNNDSPRIWFNGGSIYKPGTSILDIGKYQTLSYVMDKNNSKISVLKNTSEIFKVENTIIKAYNYKWTNAWIGRDSRTENTCLKGKIASIRIYNRKLCDSEVDKNYKVDKARFGF